MRQSHISEKRDDLRGLLWAQTARTRIFRERGIKILIFVTAIGMKINNKIQMNIIKIRNPHGSGYGG